MQSKPTGSECSLIVYETEVRFSSIVDFIAETPFRTSICTAVLLRIRILDFGPSEGLYLFHPWVECPGVIILESITLFCNSLSIASEGVGAALVSREQPSDSFRDAEVARKASRYLLSRPVASLRNRLRMVSPKAYVTWLKASLDKAPIAGDKLSTHCIQTHCSSSTCTHPQGDV